MSWEAEAHGEEAKAPLHPCLIMICITLNLKFCTNGALWETWIINYMVKRVVYIRTHFVFQEHRSITMHVQLETHTIKSWEN